MILDIIGAKYLDRNVEALAADGRLAIIGLQGGVKAELNLGALLGKRGAVIATSLRARPLGRRRRSSRRCASTSGPSRRGQVRPVVDRDPDERGGRAHRLLDAGGDVGKVLLDCDCRRAG